MTSNSHEVIKDDNNYLALTFLITVMYQLSFFIFAATFKIDTVTDLAGGTNFVILALITFNLGAFPDPWGRQIIITTLVCVWGLRLSGFLLYRIICIGEDNRFDGMRDKPFKFFLFWAFQMLWVWVVSLPVSFVNSTSKSSLSNVDIIGTVLASVGLLCEAVADQQKFNFKYDDIEPSDPTLC